MKYLLTAFALSGSMTPVAEADVWAEREALAQVASELSALERLVNDTSKLSEHDTRVKFNYDALINDLQVIWAGINTHLSQPINPIMASREDAIEGQYTEPNQ